jgi:hypothetical protein
VQTLTSSRGRMSAWPILAAAIGDCLAIDRSDGTRSHSSPRVHAARTPVGCGAMWKTVEWSILGTSDGSHQLSEKRPADRFCSASFLLQAALAGCGTVALRNHRSRWCSVSRPPPTSSKHSNRQPHTPCTQPVDGSVSHSISCPPLQQRGCIGAPGCCLRRGPRMGLGSSEAANAARGKRLHIQPSAFSIRAATHHARLNGSGSRSVRNGPQLNVKRLMIQCVTTVHINRSISGLARRSD